MIEPTSGGTRYGVMFLLILTAISSSCSATKPAIGQSADAAAFPAVISDFDEHRSAVLTHIKARSLRNRTESEVQLNLPFELAANPHTEYRGKFLLFHGLNDSAYVWTDSAKAIAARGFDVRAVLLPGHGSHPQQMLNIHYQSWLTAAREHYALWKTDDTPIYLGGFSLGAVIATILALEQQEIAGLLLFSPAYHSQLNHLLRWSWLYKRVRPWMFGGVIIEDNPIKYNSIPINSGHQYYRTTRYLKKNWNSRRLNIPVLAVLSSNDSVVAIDSVRAVLGQRFIHPNKQVIIYAENDVVPRYKGETIRNSAHLEKRVINQSHLSVLTSPENPLFGEQGTILVCNGNEWKIFSACLRAENHWYGAQHTPSPDGVAVARTTYNPDFDYVFTQFDRVFNSAN